MENSSTGREFTYILISFFRNTNKDFFQRGLFKEFVDVIKGVTFLLAAGIIALFAVKRSSDFSRLAIGIGYVLSIVLVYLCRVLYKQYLTKIYKKSSSSKMAANITEKRMPMLFFIHAPIVVNIVCCDTYFPKYRENACDLLTIS